MNVSPRHDLPGLKNFARLGPRLFRGAQPTAEGMQTLAAMGVKTVVNLRAYHSDKKVLRGTGLGYVHLMCRAHVPLKRQVAKFLRVMEDPATWPVFVHCQHGKDRTGMMVAAYRIVVEGWTAEEARSELKRFGIHVWFPMIKRFVRKMDAEKMRRRAEKRTMEKVRKVDP